MILKDTVRHILMSLPHDEIENLLTEYVYEFIVNSVGDEDPEPTDEAVKRVADIYGRQGNQAAFVFEMMEFVQPGPGILTKAQQHLVLMRLMRFIEMSRHPERYRRNDMVM